MRNENIKMFDDLSRHLELEDEHLKATKVNGSSYTPHSGSCKPSGPKRKKNQGGKNENLVYAPALRLILPRAREASMMVRRTNQA